MLTPFICTGSPFRIPPASTTVVVVSPGTVVVDAFGGTVVVDVSAATTVVLASKTGLPVSTTHAAVGGVLGVGLAGGIAIMYLMGVSINSLSLFALIICIGNV